MPICRNAEKHYTLYVHRELIDKNGEKRNKNLHSFTVEWAQITMTIAYDSMRKNNAQCSVWCGCHC